ncbi:hypothetical protein BH09MYX1_BH09MYX1_52950 [soil metagenome]
MVADNDSLAPHSETLASPAPSSTASPSAAAQPKKRRGFAAMDPKKVSEIASKGGRAAHAAGTAHEFSADEARAAGRKGGFAAHAKRKEKATEST